MMSAQVESRRPQVSHRPAIKTTATHARQDLASESFVRMHCQREARQNKCIRERANGFVLASTLVLVLVHQLLQSDSNAGNLAEAVSVQRLQVPDLLVIDQQQQLQRLLPSSLAPPGPGHPVRFGGAQAHQASAAMSPPPPPRLQNGPEAASLINSQSGQQQQLAADSASPHYQQQQQQQQQQVVTFECLISFDRRKDRNLIVKWHHDERNEPIYQWIPELNKRTVAPQYRPFIAPLLASESGHHHQHHSNLSLSAISTGTSNATGTGTATATAAANQVQLLEAGFRLVRPTKELGGRYTCSAISSQNDDSKWKKMIVYSPPKSFRFNASRTDIGALLASQRDRLIQLTQPAAQAYSPAAGGGGAGGLTQLPLAYRTRGLDPSAQVQLTTISPQMYSTIDYVNVNQQRAPRPAPALAPGSSWSPPAGGYASGHSAHQQQVMSGGAASRAMTSKPRYGIKLVCDIDQVFPVPEVSIYRLARLEGAQAERLAKLDTKIERDPFTGLFRVQVTSILDDDELANIRQNYLSAPLVAAAASSSLPAASELEIQFECVIALTNLELSKYADNKRSIIYRPGQQVAQGNQWDGSSGSMNLASRTSQLAFFGSSSAAADGGRLTPLPLALCLLLCALSLVLR